MATPYPISTSAWQYRVCAFDRYHSLSVIRENDNRYETQFFACSQCSVMFLNPRQFNVFSTAALNVELTPTVALLRRR